jgi:hypothetical protein
MGKPLITLQYVSNELPVTPHARGGRPHRLESLPSESDASRAIHEAVSGSLDTVIPRPLQHVCRISN